MTRTITATLALLLAAMAAAWAVESRLVLLKTPRGVTQAFILITPDKPVASVILFAGGHGGLGLKNASSMAWGASNFLVRTRDTFAAKGFAVAVVDAPSDHPKMNAIFRISSAHAGDIAAVAAYMKQRVGVPVWLIGTSMGTFSAAEGAIAAGNVDGLVLTSTITRSKPNWKTIHSYPAGVASMPLSRVTVPTLIVSHAKDGCEVSPASGAPKLKARLSKASKVDIVLLDGGKPPQSEPCEAKAQHGYFGIETKAVDTIAAFIKANTK